MLIIADFFVHNCDFDDGTLESCSLMFSFSGEHMHKLNNINPFFFLLTNIRS